MVVISSRYRPRVPPLALHALDRSTCRSPLDGPTLVCYSGGVFVLMGERISVLNPDVEEGLSAGHGGDGTMVGDGW
jgi:hypothetical protein